MLRRGTRSEGLRPTGRKPALMWRTHAASSTTMPCRPSSTTVATPAVEQAQRKVASDSLAHHLSDRKYEEGMLSIFDLHTASQTLLQSRLLLLQSQMMLALKARLVNYYITGELGVRN